MTVLHGEDILTFPPAFATCRKISNQKCRGSYGSHSTSCYTQQAHCQQPLTQLGFNRPPSPPPSPRIPNPQRLPLLHQPRQLDLLHSTNTPFVRRPNHHLPLRRYPLGLHPRHHPEIPLLPSPALLIRLLNLKSHYSREFLVRLLPPRRRDSPLLRRRLLRARLGRFLQHQSHRTPPHRSRDTLLRRQHPNT